MKLLSIWSVNIVSALKILYNNFTSTRVDVINKGDGCMSKITKEEVIQKPWDDNGSIVHL